VAPVADGGRAGAEAGRDLFGGEQTNGHDTSSGRRRVELVASRRRWRRAVAANSVGVTLS
jgi:hypothetical protein